MDVREHINEALRTLGIEIPFVELEVPRVENHGDISTPVAMALARSLKKPPRQIAEQIKGQLESSGIFSSIEIAGPGFINMRFKTDFLHSSLKELLRSPEAFLRKDLGRGKRVQVEFVSANPTGPLHLGHGRGAAFGAALSNLLERAGFQVEREFYINDAGRQVTLLAESILARYKELKGIEYPFPEDGYRGDYIVELAKELIKDSGDRYLDSGFEEAEEELKAFGIKRMLELIRADLEDFGVLFDRWQSEKALYDEGLVKRCLDELTSKGKLYEKDGALWFRATEFGDDKDRVVIKSDGSYTYFASDIAYHWYKIQRGFDELIDVWGADHHGYVPRIKAVIRALEQPEEKLTVMLVQMVNLLREGRPVQMSKRAGEFVTLKEVMEEVGADTTKFIFLTRRPDSHLDFDIEVAKRESSENPVYYVQYAYARINSIFKKALEEGVEINGPEGIELLTESEELALIKKLLFYPLMFEGAVREREPHRITFYLQELARLFHSYYNRHRVVSDDRALSVARLSLCRAIMTVINEGLSILGVTAPERM
ncbi:MAG: arginine--tRNA ligase [Nitrospirae bacterium]|nr:MAG: arginine--tRNA ligase [Nitrospirota bacterium]